MCLGSGQGGGAIPGRYTAPVRPSPPLAALLVLAALSAGCANLGYYGHLARGQMQLLGAREDITRIVADESRDPVLRERLRQVQDARRFASQQLGLPDNASYTEYADLGRPYVVWNVFAAPEFSLEAVEHCFLLTGCLAYRGYFDEAQARAQAAVLQAAGNEVYVAGIPAYSTLGWFDDPVLSTMMHWDDARLIGTLFHELAHQQLFIKGDTAFNESFASFVEDEGLRQYLAARGGGGAAQEGLKRREHQFTALLLAARSDLEALYRSPLRLEAMQAAKTERFARLQADYQRLRDGDWQGWGGYDRFFAEGLNNAKLLPFGLYDGWVPAFAALFRQQQSEWPAFYAAAKKLGAEPGDRRQALLEQLASQAK